MTTAQEPTDRRTDDAILDDASADGAVPDVAVIGGGLAGLTAALQLARAGRSVTVFERRSRLGGLAVTDRRDGFSFNQGPHAFYKGGAGEDVLSELGVEIRGGTPPVRGSVVIEGRAEIGPAGPVTLLRTSALSLKDKAGIGKLLATLPRIDSAALATTTTSDWIERSVSGDRARLYLRGLCRLATYAADLDALSAEVAVSQLQSALGAGVLYLHDGWQSLVDQLEAQLASHPTVRIERGETISELPAARTVIIAAGGPAIAGRLLGRRFDVGPPALASCVDLGLNRAPDRAFAIGADVPFYFSNHSAVADLAPDGLFYAAVAQYLTPDDEPDHAGLEAFLRLAGVREEDVVTRRRLHSMTTVSALATADRGGLAGRQSVALDDRADVFLAGDWVGPVGHLADAVLHSARDAARRAIAHLASLDRTTGTGASRTGTDRARAVGSEPAMESR